MSMAGQKIRVGEVDLNVLVSGDGPAILLLHGFPDSNALWREVAPALVRAGYRVVAPDQRGFGFSSAPEGVTHYRVEHIVGDAVGLLDGLGIDRAHVVGHDWGAVIGWLLAGEHADRVRSLTAISVGHPRAYANAGFEQKRKGWYTLLFQLRGVTEGLLSANDFRNLRRWARRHPDLEHAIAEISRPGRLTAGLNWYRANLIRILFGRHPRCPVPTLGVWSTEDFALAEDQMTGSRGFVDGRWRYHRFEGLGHWLPLEAPDRLVTLILEFIEERSST